MCFIAGGNRNMSVYNALSILLFTDKNMARTKSKKTREEKLVEAKLRRRKKYEEIKKDPEKQAVQKLKERLRYLKSKEQKQIKSVADMTPREKRLQRKKWKENSKRYI